MSEMPISPLRRRMIEYMTVRQFRRGRRTLPICLLLAGPSPPPQRAWSATCVVLGEPSV